MKVRKIIMALSALTLLCMVTGCGKTEPEKEKVTIYMRNYADHKGVYSEDEPDADYDDMTSFMADQFIAQYDKYDVTIKTEYFALEDEPKFVEDKYDQPDATDIVFQDTFVNLGHIYEGRVVPLDDVIPDAIRKDVGEDFEQLYTIDGKAYIGPYGRLPTVFLYNAELFRQAGLSEYITEKGEIADWSIEQWNDILARLKENLPDNVYPMMMYGSSTNGDMVNMMLLRMFGNPFFDENGNACLNDENGIKALRWIKDNYDKGYYPPGAENLDLMDCFELYANEQLAIYFGNNIINKLPNVSSIDFRYALYPSESGRGNSFDFSYTFAIFDNNDEKRIEVSKDFLRFLYGKKELLNLGIPFGQMSAFSSITGSSDADVEIKKQWKEIQDTRIDFTNGSPNYPGIREVFYPEITAMLSGDQTPEETARNLDEKINAALEIGRTQGSLHD